MGCHSAGSNHKAVPLVDLGFDIHLSGRAAKPLHAEVVRELTQSDLALLATERGVQPSHVQRITDRHHALARCLASGMSATEAGLCTGYTGSRISILRGDPAFEELISFYRADKGKAVEDLQSKFTALAKDATTVLQDRLEDDPDKFVVAELLDVVKLAADRSGNGPSSKTTNVNVNVNLGDRMKAARERVAALSPPGDRDTGAKAISHETALVPSFIEGEFTEISTRKGWPMHESSEYGEAGVGREMPRYVSHKKVWALEIATVNRLTCRVSFKDEGYAPIQLPSEMWSRYQPVEGDFYVQYADGYKSFSPRKAFLEGYTPETETYPTGSQSQ